MTLRGHEVLVEVDDRGGSIAIQLRQILCQTNLLAHVLDQRVTGFIQILEKRVL